MKKHPNPEKALSERIPSLGTWMQIGHPAIAEILAARGFEWLVLDCEHGEAGDADIAGFCRAVRPFSCLPLVRVRENADLPIRRALDLGAAGVIVPLVHDAAAAERAVAASAYPPRGVRGFAWQRANNWGADFDSYAAGFNPRVIVMIESRAAVEQIDGIVAVKGVDACLIGPYDLSGSYGLSGQTEHAALRAACARVVKACARHGKGAGLHLVVPSAAKVRAARRQGYTFLALGMDSFFLRDGALRARQWFENAR